MIRSGFYILIPFFKCSNRKFSIKPCRVTTNLRHIYTAVYIGSLMYYLRTLEILKNYISPLNSLVRNPKTKLSNKTNKKKQLQLDQRDRFLPNGSGQNELKPNESSVIK